jgi:hypothetical protein
MPYEIRSEGGRFCLYKKGSDESLGCHDAKAGAAAQMRALYAAEGISMDKFAENLNELKVALNALIASHNEYMMAAASSGDESQADIARSVRWAIEEVKGVAAKILLGQWLGEGGGAEGLQATLTAIDGKIASGTSALGEAGAKFSRDTKSRIVAALTALTGLVEIPEEEADPKAVAEALHEWVAGMETIALGLDEKPLAEAEAGRFAAGFPIILAEGTDAKLDRYKMLMIQPGMTLNRTYYSEAVLRKAMPLFEGRPQYIDHPDPAAAGRSLKDKVGWWEGISWESKIAIPGGGEASGLVATLHLLSEAASPQPWYPRMLREAVTGGNHGFVGISIYAAGVPIFKRDDKGVYKECAELTQVMSVDAVAEASAGGQPLAFAASNRGVDQDVMTIEEMMAALRENPALLGEAIKELPEFKTLLAEVAKNDAPPAPDPKPDEAASELLAEATGAKAAFEEAKKSLEETRQAMQRDRTAELVSRVLAESKLPEKICAILREQHFKDVVMDETAIRAVVDQYKGIVDDTRVAATAEMAEATRRSMTPGMIVDRGIQLSDQIGPVQQLSAAMDDFFGNPDPEMKGKYPKIRSFREFYAQVTGDSEVNGEINTRYSVLGEQYGVARFAEALPGATHVVGGGTITMTNLLGTSMNRALFNFYEAQPRWWEPVVTKVDLQNLKQQDRVRLHNFGSLTERTVDGAEYVELDWGETAEAYTPTEFGNLVPVGRRAIINDDLRGIQAIPRLLAQSAIITINEYMSAKWTVNSGAGPALADTFNVFNAAQHQGNLVSTTLNHDNLIAARHIMMKMNNDAGKRIGIMPRTLLVPIDLEDVAFRLTESAQQPGTANNDPNIISNTERGIRRVIVVPQWTSATRWYIHADPSQITSIELGFLYGREDPELFAQTAETAGMVFTNDVMNHKIRHDYGGDWLDYRGAVRGN